MSVVCAKRLAGPVMASDHFGLLAQLPEYATIAASVLRLIAHRPATTRMQLR